MTDKPTDAAVRAARAITDDMGVLRAMSYMDGEARVAATIDRSTGLAEKEAALRAFIALNWGDDHWGEQAEAAIKQACAALTQGA